MIKKTFLTSPSSIIWIRRIVLVIILITATGLRLYRLGYPSLWIDEIGQVLVAELPFPQFWTGVEMHHGAAPLDYLITKSTIFLGCNSDFMLRLPVALWGVLAIYWTFRLGKQIFSYEVGLLSAAMLAINPFHLTYSQELRFYSLFIFITLLATEVFLHAWKKDQWRWWFFYSVVVLLMIYSHYYGSLVIILHGAWAVFDRFWLDEAHSRDWFQRFLRFLIAASIASALFLPWIIYDLPKEKGFVGATPPDLTIDLIKNVLRDMIGLQRGAWPALLLAFSGVVTLFRKRKSIALVLGLWLIGLLPTALWIDHHHTYFFHSRQIIFGLPFLLILIAGGLESWLKLLADVLRHQLGREQWQWVHSGLPLIIFIGIALAYLPKLISHYRFQDGREDWKGAGKLLELNLKPGDKLIFPSNAEHYYIKHYLPADIWKDSVIAENKAQMEGIFSQGTPAWVLVSPYTDFVNPEMSDIGQWLEERGGIRFPYSQRFNLYFIWPDSDDASMKTRAQEWKVSERVHWWVVVGKAMSRAGSHKAALEAYRHAATLPDFSFKQVQAFNLAGNEALMLGNAKLALTFFDQALEKDDDNASAQLLRARTLLDLHRPEEAITTLRNVEQQTGPEDYWLQWLSGKSYAVMGDWDKAIEAYRHALTISPQEYRIYFFLAQAYKQKGDVQQARVWYQSYLKYEPDGPYAKSAQEFLKTP